MSEVTPEIVVWHDLECGIYRADLAFWRGLAADSGDPVLDIGAGSGRVSLDLARGGHLITALDSDAELLAAVRLRADRAGAEVAGRVSTVRADARSFDLGDQRFALCIVPMQTIQLLGGQANRLAFLRRARAHLVAGGVLAVALAPDFEEFSWSDGDAYPLPDIVELEGTVYASQPTAVRIEGETVVLERRREVIDAVGGRVVSEDRIALDLLSGAEMIAEGVSAGLRSVGIHTIPDTDEHVGSLVVIFRA